MSNAINVLTMNLVKSEVVKGSIVSNEKNVRGDSVQWLRLSDEYKSGAGWIATSKQNQEFAAYLPPVDVESGIRWLADNASLANVREWFEAKIIAANRPLIANAGAGNLNSVDLVNDIESLIAFDTLETQRGRKASSLNLEQWKAISPLVVDFLRLHYQAAGAPDKAVQQLTNKYLGLIKAVTVSYSPIGDAETYAKVGEFINGLTDYVVNVKPELESVALFMVQVCENNRLANVMTDEDLSAWD